MNSRTLPIVALLYALLVDAAFIIPPCTARAANPELQHKAVAIYAPYPIVPEAARLKHLRGSGVFRCYVRPDGTVSRVTIDRSTGSYILDTATIATLAQWRFKPGSRDQIKVRFNYKL